MIVSRRVRLFAAAFAALALAGCQTTKKSDPVATTPVVVEDFMPVQPVSRLQLESGRYPNLFYTTSYALWVTQGVATAKLDLEKKSGAEINESLATDANIISANYYVIEVNVESMFPDTSIAYDVVGLRAIDAYLTLPDGTRILPAQRVLGTSAKESQEGALKLYGRTNILVFPKIDVLSGAPTIPAGVTGIQLTLDGFNSIYHFDWAAAPSLNPPAVSQESGGLTWSSLYSKLRELSRLTQ